MLANVMKLGVIQPGSNIFPAEKMMIFDGMMSNVRAALNTTLIEINRLKSRAIRVLHKLWKYIYSEKPKEITESTASNHLVDLGFQLQE